jgi:DNA end-binding protein Ku
VVNLMEALRKSIADGRGADGRAASKKSRKRVEGQREMLLPIAGKKAAAESEKKPARTSGRQKKAG